MRGSGSTLAERRWRGQAGLGVSDSPLWIGATGLLVLNLVLWAICYCVLQSGWKIKN